MTRSPEELAQQERLEALYMKAQSRALLAVERSVCGCDYGASSWTTSLEAEQLAKRLGLRPGVRLLDIGAGSGWPGLRLATTSGCDAVLVDLPLSGLRIAAERAKRDGIAERISVAVADAAELPFENDSFDAISHSDLLCCLIQKRSALAAFRGVIRRHGRMVFTVISLAAGLAGERYRRAVANGPEFVEAEKDYAALLVETGWIIAGYEDITAAFAASCRRQLQADEARKDGLLALIGAEEYATRQAGWRSKLAAIEDNLLRRELFIAAPAAEQV